jgi:hypothetical protein
VSPRTAAAAAARTATARTATTRTATTRTATTRTATTPTAARAATAPASTPRARPGGPVVEPRPALHLVPPVPGRTARARTEAAKRSGPFALVVVGLLVGTTLAVLLLNIGIGANTVEATKLRAANAELAEDVQRLEQQVVDGSTPAALAAAAADAGLVPAGPAAYLVLAGERAADLRGEPSPAPEPPAPSSGASATGTPSSSGASSSGASPSAPAPAGAASSDVTDSSPAGDD